MIYDELEWTDSLRIMWAMVDDILWEARNAVDN